MGASRGLGNKVSDHPGTEHGISLFLTSWFGRDQFSQNADEIIELWEGGIFRRLNN